jgi:hypothetical protein
VAGRSPNIVKVRASDRELKLWREYASPDNVARWARRVLTDYCRSPYWHLPDKDDPK